jgi:chromosome segregation ATPase
MQQIEQGKQDLAETQSQIKQAISDLKVQQANLKAQEADLKAQVAQARADIQQREVQVEVKNMQTDQRGAALEAQAGAAGQQQALQIVQDVLGQVSQQIKALESRMGQNNQQPIIVPVGGGRRRVKVSRGPGGELMGDIEDVMDDGIG